VIRLTAVIGQPAVALNDARQIGTVDGAVVRDGRVVALTVKGTVIPASAVRTFEGDAVTFEPYATVDDSLAAAASPVVGRMVLTPSGDGLGPLVDLDLDATGVVESVELADRTIPGTHLRVIGSYAAIVTEDEPHPLPPPIPPDD
jgi:uncharacterized protein YrrD